MPSYDFFVDENKERRLIGITAVTNAMALEQVLATIRSQYTVGREIKWNSLDRFRLPVAASWIRVAGWFTGVKFACIAWPKGVTKGDVVLAFLQAFLAKNRCSMLAEKYDSVVFTDFDDADKKPRMHDYIRRRANVLRCYPVDSKSMNLLQLTDLLMGCWTRSGGAVKPQSEHLEKKWPGIEEKLRAKERLTIPEFTGAECKDYIGAFASARFRKIRPV